MWLGCHPGFKVMMFGRLLVCIWNIELSLQIVVWVDDAIDTLEHVMDTVASWRMWSICACSHMLATWWPLSHFTISRLINSTGYIPMRWIDTSPCNLWILFAISFDLIMKRVSRGYTKFILSSVVLGIHLPLLLIVWLLPLCRYFSQCSLHLRMNAARSCCKTKTFCAYLRPWASSSKKCMNLGVWVVVEKVHEHGGPPPNVTARVRANCIVYSGSKRQRLSLPKVVQRYVRTVGVM